MKRACIVFSLVFLIFSTTLLFSQADRGGITGRITDSTGAILPKTTITLRNEATGVIQTTVSNDDGIYNFQQLNPGSYTLTVARSGFTGCGKTLLLNQVSLCACSFGVDRLLVAGGC